MNRFPAILLALALLLTGCQGGGTSSATKLRIGASPVPHAEILAFVRDNLASDSGLEIEIVEFNDYIQPNVALADKAIDANYFQHRPYLDSQVAERGYRFAAVAAVHLEPLGIYGGKARSLAALAVGATIGIPNDPSNIGRALKLLAANNLITLKDTGERAPTVQDIATNPRNIKLTELEAAQLPRSLGDLDAAVINGNYAIPAGLDPAKGALALEKAEGNPYANLLVARQDNASDAGIKKLAELLCSTQTKKFIADKYAGAVVSACA